MTSIVLGSYHFLASCDSASYLFFFWWTELLTLPVSSWHVWSFCLSLCPISLFGTFVTAKSSPPSSWLLPMPVHTLLHSTTPLLFKYTIGKSEIMFNINWALRGSDQLFPIVFSVLKLYFRTACIYIYIYIYTGTMTSIILTQRCTAANIHFLNIWEESVRM